MREFPTELILANAFSRDSFRRSASVALSWPSGEPLCSMFHSTLALFGCALVRGLKLKRLFAFLAFAI
jgi:hypothetical protein